MSTAKHNYQEWEHFNKDKAAENYPKWPNEVMLKLVFGNYLKNKISINSDSKVLDVGCGFGNNLLPFIDKGCDCYGVEVTENMAAQTQNILNERGLKANIIYGKNRSLPFEDNFFDLLLSINTIHYEANSLNMNISLHEFNRVLKNRGKLLLITIGVEHTLIKRAQLIDDHIYMVQDYDFRDGLNFYCFENKRFLKFCLEKIFNNVEGGRVTEDLMEHPLDFLCGVCEAKK